MEFVKNSYEDFFIWKIIDDVRCMRILVNSNKINEIPFHFSTSVIRQEVGHITVLLTFLSLSFFITTSIIHLRLYYFLLFIAFTVKILTIYSFLLFWTHSRIHEIFFTFFISSISF